MAFALILVASMAYAAPENIDSIDLYGFSMNLPESTGGQAVAAFEITLPEEYSLVIPVLFFGNSETVNISVVFDNTNFIDQDLDILSSELKELDYDSAANINNLSYIIVDIDYYKSQTGELRIVLDSSEPAELFVLSPEKFVSSYSVETICDVLTGEEFGLCNAYCKAMDCGIENHAAADMACTSVNDNFENLTGRRLPEGLNVSDAGEVVDNCVVE